MYFPLSLRVFAAASLVAVGLIAVSRSQHDKLTAAVADAAQARQGLAAALDTAAHERQFVDSARHVAQLAIVSRDSAVARADSIELRAVSRQGAYAVVARTAPDTCRPVIAAADSVIATQDSVIRTQSNALRIAQEATSGLQTALDTSRATIARLWTASVPAELALSHVVKVEHPSVLRRIATALTPKFGVGVAAGFDAFGKPNVVTGFTLGLAF